MNGCMLGARALAIAIALLMCVATVVVTTPNAAALTVEYCNDIDDLPGDRIFAGVVSDGDRLFVIGGFLSDWSGIELPMNTTIVYDISTGEFTYGSPMPNGTGISGCVLGDDGLIYVLGGWNTTAYGGYSGAVQIYDPVADTWTNGSAAPASLGAFTPVWGADGRIYAIGGAVYSQETTLIYDPGLDSWSYGANQPDAYWLRSTVVWNETAIFTFAGRESFAPSTDAHLYNPVTDTWASIAPLLVATVAGTAIVADNGLIYYIGGEAASWVGEGTPQNSIQRYDPETDSWEFAGASLPTGRSALGSAMDSYGRIYVIGGYDGIDVVPTMSLLVVAEIETDKLQITSPADGSIVSGVVSVDVTISNFWMGFSTMSLYVDGELLESRMLNWPWEAVTFMWDTTGLEDSSDHDLLVIGYLWSGEERRDSVTATVWSVSVEERIAELQMDLMGLEAQLADVEINLANELADQAADLATLQALVDALQAAIDALATSVDEDNAAMVADLVALQAQLATLDSALDDMQDSLDDTQDSVDDLQDSVDGLQGSVNETQNSVDDVQDSVDDVTASVDNKMDGMLGYAIIGLLVVVILLMAIMMIMGRKPKTPEPMPEPPIE